MKRLIIFFSILFLTTSIMVSQTINNYGIKVGYVNSNQVYTNKDINESTKRKSGFSFSAFIDLFNFYGISISPEIKYIQKGVGLEMVLTGPDSPEPIGKRIDYVYHNYLSIPISLVYKISSGFGQTFIKVAPRYDILLNSHDDFIVHSSYKDYKNSFGGTISLGLIPKLNIGFNAFIETSYHFDFTDVFENQYMSIKNNAFEISLGIMI